MKIKNLFPHLTITVITIHGILIAISASNYILVTRTIRFRELKGLRLTRVTHHIQHVYNWSIKEIRFAPHSLLFTLCHGQNSLQFPFPLPLGGDPTNTQMWAHLSCGERFWWEARCNKGHEYVLAGSGPQIARRKPANRNHLCKHKEGKIPGTKIKVLYTSKCQPK